MHPPSDINARATRYAERYRPRLLDRPKVAAIRARLRGIGIELVDINPRNIAFAEADDD